MAARDVGKSELDMIRRIPTYGIKLSHFANNLGNSFRTYHKDPRLRYPETNQFSVDLSTVESGEDIKAFKGGYSMVRYPNETSSTGPESRKWEDFYLHS